MGECGRERGGENEDGGGDGGLILCVVTLVSIACWADRDPHEQEAGDSRVG